MGLKALQMSIVPDLFERSEITNRNPHGNATAESRPPKAGKYPMVPGQLSIEYFT